MNDIRHEPGPWVLGGCSGRMITTPSGYVGDGFIADVDTLANARLISAAPELLEALQKSLPIWENMRLDASEASVLLDCRAAIEKAIGNDISG